MTAAKSKPTDVVVVDGSNIATEGRSTPSLSQLNDAVLAFREEFPDAVVTVVVDATFGHRIDKKEAADFDAAVAHNELVAPPAGAIGRGDAFVLSIANKVGARILSNDSFQEFHGAYPWLFDGGRLIGGKPVPYIGWVFVERLPVKGPVSRKAQRAAKGPRDAESKSSRRSASREASLPMPVPVTPPPGARRAAKAASPEPFVAEPVAAAVPAANATSSGPTVNELLPFLEFVEHHPVGSSVNGVVESYSSHGAYVTLGDLRGYVPLRLMSDPPPRSAREVMRVGDAVTLVVTNFAPARRSVDLAVPEMAPGARLVPTPDLEELAEAIIAPAKKATAKRPTRRAPATRKAAAAVAETPVTPVKKAPARRGAAKRAASTPESPAMVSEAPVGVPAAEAPVKKAAAKKAPAAKKATPAKEAAEKKSAAKTTPARKTAARKRASEGEQSS
jgi:hypothetical protein